MTPNNLEQEAKEYAAYDVYSDPHDIEEAFLAGYAYTMESRGVEEMAKALKPFVEMANEIFLTKDPAEQRTIYAWNGKKITTTDLEAACAALNKYDSMQNNKP